MLPFARLLILREGKKHAITRLAGRGSVEDHANPLSF